MLVQYARNKKGEPTAVLVAEKIESDGPVLIGWAGCDPHDRFDKRRGLEIARGRIDIGDSGYCIPYRLRRMIPDFEDRCRRYFKTTDIFVAGYDDPGAVIGE